MNKYWYFLNIFLLFSSAQLHAEQLVPVAPKSDWVIEKEYNLDPQIPHNAIKKGVYYLLVDAQIKVNASGEQENYRHFAQHIVNQNGIEETSQLNISFDPSYQNLTLNSVLVWREGKSIDKTTTAKMAILQREEELENLIYNGEHTLNIILGDIRVGDIIEYSYTRVGANPIFQGIFGYKRYLQWSVPIDSLHFRLLWEKPEPLHYKFYNSQLTLNEKATANGYVYWLEQKHLDALESGDKVPSWFDPYGAIQFSELNSWNDVVKWGTPLYEDAIQSSEKIKSIVADIKKNNISKEGQIAAALQYVQSEVRYLGIEIGENSHKPSAADETLNRRYGDCKDKAVVLISLLRELQVEAFPALVHTDLKKELINSLPSISSFDHVIVQAIHNNKPYWLDPTRQYQYGSLKDIYQPYYDYALVINSTDKALTPIKPDQVESLYFVKDTFDLTSENRNEVIYTSDSEYYGLNAERQRDSIANNGLTKTQSNFLDYFKDYYSAIKPIESVIFTDKPAINKLYGHEKYLIENFWIKNEAETKYDADFYANAISSYLKEPEQTSLKEPNSISYPVNIRQLIEITFNSGGWSFENEKYIDDNEFFYFSSAITYDDSTRLLTLDYEYKSKASYVPADKTDSYIASINKANDNLGYSIYENIQTTSVAPVEEPIDWFLIVVFSYIILFSLVILLWLYDSRRNPFTGETLYYPVSHFKLISLWVLSFGLYALYWFYKNWFYVKHRDGSSIMPTARGIFSHFWYYPLYSELKTDNNKRFDESHLPGKTLAVIYAISFLLLGLFSDMGSFTILFLILSALLILPLANYINFINNNNAAYAHNSKWSPRHYLLAFLSTPLLILTMGSEIGLTANEAVVSGNKVLSHNIKFMQRKGIMDTNDNLIYFYSGAFLNIHDDGNGITDRHVFSYWKDDNGDFNYETARFDEIKDIKTTFAKSWGDDTVIDIIKNDDTKFLLFISSTSKKDRLFVNALMDRWEGDET